MAIIIKSPREIALMKEAGKGTNAKRIADED